MPGSTTTPGHMGTRAVAPICIAFQQSNGVGSRDKQSFTAQWLAYALPYRRFACTLTGTCARLGADAVRYSFIVADFHHLLLAGFTGALLSPVSSTASSAFPRKSWVGVPRLSCDSRLLAG
jgi:hypothetical protein